jgi:hypothetical protein
MRPSRLRAAVVSAVSAFTVASAHVVVLLAATGCIAAAPQPRPARPVASPGGVGVVVVVTTPARVAATGCADDALAALPGRVDDELRRALQASGFTVVGAETPHALRAVVETEVRYCNPNVGLMNGAVAVALEQGGAPVQRRVAEGELSTASPLASVARDVVQALLYDEAVIAAVDRVRAAGSPR